MAHKPSQQEQQLTQRIRTNESHIATLAEGFLIERKARNLTAGTVNFYREKLKGFLVWADALAVTEIDQLTPAVIRTYLLYLEETGHTAGGIHAFYRTLRAFAKWYADEFDRPDFQPFAKVKAPHVPQELLEPAAIEDIRAMLATCADNFTGVRDRAILLFLLDTGVRANELLQLNRVDLDTVTGTTLIRMGKGRKPRYVFTGRKTRRALRAYLKRRDDTSIAVFVTIDRERLTYNGLREIVRRRARRAGIHPPKLHSFRRAFALLMLRAGVDVFSLQRLLGHSGLEVLRRYLAQDADDLHAAHDRAGVVDRAL